MHFSGSYGDDVFNQTFTKEQESVSIVGTWVNTDTTTNNFEMTFEFTEDGKVKISSAKYPADSSMGSYFNGEGTYTGKDGVYTASAIDYTWTFTLSADGVLNVKSQDSDGFVGNVNDINFTKA